MHLDKKGPKGTARTLPQKTLRISTNKRACLTIFDPAILFKVVGNGWLNMGELPILMCARV